MALQIREYIDTDWTSVWPIFQEVVTAGDTFAYDPEWTSEEARDVWVVGPPGLTAHACSGRHTWDQTAPVRAHMSPPRASWSPEKRGDGGSDVRSASTRSLGLVSKDTPLCSPTRLWNRTTSPCGFGRRSDFASSGPFLRLLSTPR
jgi:hypothetical protein